MSSWQPTSACSFVLVLFFFFQRVPESSEVETGIKEDGLVTLLAGHLLGGTEG